MMQHLEQCQSNMPAMQAGLFQVAHTKSGNVLVLQGASLAFDRRSREVAASWMPCFQLFHADPRPRLFRKATALPALVRLSLASAALAAQAV